MELILKSAAIALVSAIVGLIIKKYNPEISILLSSCTVAMIGIAAVSFASNLKNLVYTVRTIAGTSDVFVAPILKCVGIAIITKLTSELCRDSAQSASASAVELAGTVCAMSVAMPLIMNALALIGEMV